MKYLIALLALASTPAMAQPACGPHSNLVEMLAESYGESRQAIAINQDGSLMEVYASEDGSWTIVFSDPAGGSCIVAGGEAFQLTHEPLPPAGQEG